MIKYVDVLMASCQDLVLFHNDVSITVFNTCGYSCVLLSSSDFPILSIHQVCLMCVRKLLNIFTLFNKYSFLCCMTFAFDFLVSLFVYISFWF